MTLYRIGEPVGYEWLQRMVAEGGLVPVEPIEMGYWCEAEGIYFTDPQEHMTEATYLKRGSGSLGHYGYECEGRRTTLRVGVFRIGGDE